MEKHFELSDDEFEKQFCNCELNASLFSHEAHLRLAWIHLNKYGLKKAECLISSQLQRYVKYVGAVDKYNTTLTLAAVKAVHHFMLNTPFDNFHEFIIRNARLKYNFRELISNHYSIDIFNSEQAKIEFIEPDLLPFD